MRCDALWRQAGAASAIVFFIVSPCVTPPLQARQAPSATASSPLIGKPPPLPFSYPQWLRLRDDPSTVRRMQSSLPPVSSAPAAAPPTGGAWQLGPQPPGSPPLSNPLLLTDGSVIAHVSCTGAWWRLTPDLAGNYAHGSWSPIASLPSGYTPRFFSSAVLPDGRVIAEGGEYNINCDTDWTNRGAIYDPLTDSWTAVAPPGGWTTIGDAPNAVLADGTYMQADCCESPAYYPLKAALLDPVTLTWTETGTNKFDDYDEEGWTLLPDGTLLTVDAYVGTLTCGAGTERYSPATGAWTSAGDTPYPLADCSNPSHMPSSELGPQVLQPDGTVIAFGGTVCSAVANSLCIGGSLSLTTHTAIFDPMLGGWSNGPDIPAVGRLNYSLADAPAALLPSGNVLFAASPNYQAFVPPTHFFELNGTDDTIAQVSDPTDAASFTSFQWNFLVLPTGEVLALETDGSNVWIYTPSGSANARWAPAVAAAPATLVAGATYRITGTQFNGLSQGAAYGDDQQAATNYPIVRIVNSASGHVFYARSFDHGTMSVASNAAGSTHFTVPSNLDPGRSDLYVVANGIASQPVRVAAARRRIVGTGDFNGDGKSDILWRYKTGEVAVWEMDGGQILASLSLGSVPNDWTIIGTGDFNGDGTSDILWRYKTGETAIWEMSGGRILASLASGVAATDWTIAGIGDFNGDGTSDILWRYKTGYVVIWEMDGARILAQLGLGDVPVDWTIAGTGDFNGDGKSDILWRYKSGAVVIWEMDGGRILASLSLGSVPNDWTIAGTGDFNGDGKSDILWRYKAGDVAIWEMNGGEILASPGSGAVPPLWTLVQ